MKSALAIALATTCLAAPALAASDAATRFGVREDVQQMSLSPDGTKIAYIEPSGARAAVVYVISTAGGAPVPVATSTGDPDRLQFCRWSSDTRIVCNIYMTVDSGVDTLAYSRMISVDADGKNRKTLSARDSEDATDRVFNGGGIIDWSDKDSDASVLMTRTFVPERTTGTFKQEYSGFGVERVDTRTLARTMVEKPSGEAMEYLSDGYGTVRIKGLQRQAASGYDTKSISYLYRAVGSREWQPLGAISVEAGRTAGFNPVAVDRDKNLVYGFDASGDHTALFSVQLDSGLQRQLVLARPDADVDDLIRIGRHQRVVGASYATDRRQSEYFDPELKRLAASLSKALPGLPLVTFVDASADEKKLLLFAGSDVDPGRYYLYDKTTRHLDQVSPARPQLAGTKLAAVQPVTYPAADGVQVPGYLTLPPGATSAKGLPAIVLPHGGPGYRDEWGFDWLPQFFANRGYAVLQPNFRGSTGYGDAWFKDNGFKSWRIAIGDVNDGGRWLIKQGVDLAHLAILGWSYGGYAALQSAVLDPTLFKAIVAVAPVTDLVTFKNESSDLTNHLLIASYIGSGPHLVQGSPAQNVGRITAPVLLFHGDHDQNVGIGESRLMASRLKAAGKPVELVEFKRLDHQLEDSFVRAQMLDKMDAFLRTSLALPPAP